MRQSLTRWLVGAALALAVASGLLFGGILGTAQTGGAMPSLNLVAGGDPGGSGGGTGGG